MTNPFRAEFPFYQPCCVLMLDDNEEFLRSVRAALNEDHAVLCYTSPSRALERLKSAEKQAAQGFYPFSSPSDETTPGDGDQLVVFQASTLEDIGGSDDRYNMISVAIIDEVMPEMRGLEFCRKLQHSGIKTILLTGEMTDPAQTIAAFNDGIIDRFISKGDSAALDKINVAIAELQQRFFAEKSAALYRATMAAKKHRLTSDQLNAVMAEAYAVFPYTEYYFHSKSGGYLLRALSGATKICLFSDRRTQSEVADFLADQEGGLVEAQKLRRGGHLLPWEFLNDEIFDEDIVDPVVQSRTSFAARAVGDTSWCLIEEADMPSSLHDDPLVKTTSWSAYKSGMLAVPLNDETAT